ncbi:ABC transporter ATP-binding protein [Candidatus Avoscillospira sp. LCP25S3_F1]|uniref:ABC transporter ATP-binding protein n=1 Tax=Candidatus Avoscillospira sp. LCP25S3_F1 TaxID=3438825 RepID=UPI003F90FA86
MRKRDLRRPFVRQFYRRNRVNFSLAMLTTVAMAIVNLVISWMLQQAMDLIAGVEGTLPLQQLLWVFFGVVITIILVGLLRAWVMPRFYARAMGQYKDYAFEQLLRKNISSFAGENTSTYLSAFSNDTASIELNYLENLFTLVMDSLLCLGAFVMMFWYSPLLTVIASGLSLLSLAASLLTGKRLVAAEKEVSRKNDSFLSMLKDGLVGFSVIKSFRSEKDILKLFSESNRQVQNAKAHSNRLRKILNTIGIIAGLIAQFGVFLTAAAMAVAGWDVTPGMAWVFLQLSGLAVMFLEEAPSLFSNRAAALGLVEKLACSLAENVREEGRPIPNVLNNGIQLRNLSFAYPGGEAVLHKVNVLFQAGKSYALVGTSGSGKSTLLNLLMAGQDGYDGEIFYDERELRSIHTDSLYELVSLVEQNVFVFNSTLRNNITMFQNFPEIQIKRAESLSGLSNLVKQKGENYLCGENGVGLSGGERQRIAIARCLLRETPVLLVDEATSALDKETAYRVTSSILDLKGLTRIVVTHSLEEALLRRYDDILVLSHGRVVEEGKFDQLMEQKGLLYSLFTVAQ